MTVESTRRAIQEERRRARRQTRRRWPRRLLIAAIILVVVAGGLYGGAKWYANYRYDQIKKVSAPHLKAAPAAGQPINVLVIGSDSRAFSTTTAKSQFGTATVTPGQRSDVTMVARFVPATDQIYILSIPRDLWVTIPGGVTGVSGWNRINAAFNTGPDLLIQTIETDLHIPINHYLAVTFKGFEQMVTAVGGVDMNFGDPVKTSYTGLDITQTGCQVVLGKTALELVRSRHLYYEATGEWQYDGLSDFSRIQRQDAFFRALLDKVRTIKLDPIAINNFLGAAVKYLTIDSTFSENDLITLAEEFHSMPSANLHTETLPTVSYTTTAGADVLEEVQPDDAQTIDAFLAEGTTPTAATTTTKPPLAASTVSVQVLNGVTFTKPLASETSSALRSDGFAVSGIDNAPATVATTQIQYATGHKAAAQTLQDVVVGTSQLVADPSLSGNNVVLTLGASFTSVQQTTSTSTSTPTATPTATRTGSQVPVSSGDIYTNTQSEPWNPVPCTTPR